MLPTLIRSNSVRIITATKFACRRAGCSGNASNLARRASNVIASFICAWRVTQLAANNVIIVAMISVAWSRYLTIKEDYDLGVSMAALLWL